MTEEQMGLTIHRAEHLMPAMSMGDAAERFNALATFTSKIMREGIDYGVIPGTGDKATLLKPGAEKLTTFFGLTVRYQVVEKAEDWTGKEHGGEPFFYYWFRCQLWRGDLLIAEADGSCNSWEQKYRYRWADRICPNCEKSTIKRSKFAPRGRPDAEPGWYCYGKIGGCGANFEANDPAIVNQEAGQMANPNPADTVNTVQKMAQKRALVAATLLAVNASEYYTQDLEDLAIDAVFTVATPEPAPEPKAEPPKVEPFEGIPSNHTELFAALQPLGYYDHGKHMLNALNKITGEARNGWPMGPDQAEFYANAHELLTAYAKEQQAQEVIQATAQKLDL